MRFPVAIEIGDRRHCYGVVVPDLPGCFSAGDTFDEALSNAQDAILLSLEALLDDGKSLPEPSTIEKLRRKREFRQWTWAIVDVDMSQLGEKATKINVMLPQRVLRAVDAHARRHGETRSGFLARAAIAAMTKNSVS